MNIKLNGEWVRMDVRTVSDIVERLGLTDRVIIVEAGGVIVDRSDWPSAAVTDGMAIEIVHFVAGG